MISSLSGALFVPQKSISKTEFVISWNKFCIRKYSEKVFEYYTLTSTGIFVRYLFFGWSVGKCKLSIKRELKGDLEGRCQIEFLGNVGAFWQNCQLKRLNTALTKLVLCFNFELILLWAKRKIFAKSDWRILRLLFYP